MPVSKKQLEQLASFLEPTGPNDDGEWGMKCPLHNDTKRSASLNVDSALWFCQACDVGGRVTTLLRQMRELGVESASTEVPGSKRKARGSSERLPYNDNHVAAWKAALLANTEAREDFQVRRGLSSDSLAEYEIGWDSRTQAYTIPVRDINGELVNVRFYQLDPAEDRRKIWGVAGHGDPVLYPIDHLLDGNEIIVCEGELDAILTKQHGFNTITKTGGAKVWHPEWNQHFAGMVVYICNDMDKDGRAGSRKIATALKTVADEVYEVSLPYEVEPKHGKDLTDFWLEGHTPEEFRAILDAARSEAPTPAQAADRAMVDVRVVDSMGAEHYGDRMRMRVTVTGKRNPPYMLPKEVHFSCSMDAGPKCKFCPMADMDGNMRRTVAGNDEILLSMMGSTEVQVRNALREKNSIQKCGKLDIDVLEYQPVEELYVRPSIDQQMTSKDPGDYTSRRIYSTSRHDTKTNSTVEVVGSVYPSPKNQMNEFMAWEVQPVDTDIDKFELTPEVHEQLKVFQNDDPLYGLDLIADDLSANVTRIYGRSQMHVFMDLVFHSVLGFKFLGEYVEKGWLDAIIAGDTRTGKSKVADLLRQHYGLGEMISCESASFAGMVGGVQQFSTNVWEVSWGSIPLNDRRLVILDEISGLTPHEIAQMSSIRSAGEAQITKIKAERTPARTRLLWIGNPRDARMSDYTYGVYSIKPLVGNNEDIARFDMAMSVASDEVDAADINSTQQGTVEHKFTSEACRNLLLWCWSRDPDQIVWAKGVEEFLLRLSLELSENYREDPPLIQGANVRMKLARIAVAIAARLFSTDRTGECVVVKKSHAQAAFDFLDTLYRQERFGYHQVSYELMRDEVIAEGHVQEASDWAWGHPNAAKLMKTRHSFKRSDLEDILNVSREEANGIVNTLWDWRMIRRQGPDNIPVPTFQKILREVET